MLTRTVVVDRVTRIEGHAKISLSLNEAREIESATFHVTEFRGFEKFCERRPYGEMPAIMSRVCGICPISHILASSKAGDMLLGVHPPPAAVKQRRLANYAQILQSHALSFFHLSSPDLLLGMDAPAPKRNLFALLEAEPDLLRRGIRLRQFGQRVIELLGGKRIHPSWSGPGGVDSRFPHAHREEILAWIPEALESVSIALQRLKPLLDSFRPEIENMGNFPSLFLATASDSGELEYYDGKIRIMNSAGEVLADFLPERYFDHLAETASSDSYMKAAYYRPLGYPDGCYRVGPLARLNIARSAGTPRADRELAEFRQRARGPVCESFLYHLARVIEMLHMIERIEQSIDDPELFGEPVCAHASLNAREGVGSCEAPRGTLFHRYKVDENGLLTKADLLIATSQNNRAINMAVEQTARHFIRSIPAGGAPADGDLNRLEAAVRCYDPCLSCSTHALGRMPLTVEWFGPDGKLLGSLARGAA